MCQRIHCITVALITVALMLALLWPHETTAQSAQPTLPATF